MFYDSRFLNLSDDQTTCQLSYPVFRKQLYQEDINKCMSIVNSDLNSYDASFEPSIESSAEKFSRDSGNATDLNEESAIHTSSKKIHLHSNESDRNDCQLCRNTTLYLLKNPFINFLDYKFSLAESRVSLTSDEPNYDEYKLLDEFQFATSKKMTQKDSPHCTSMSPCLLINDLHEIQMDFEMNGKTVENFQPYMFGDDEENEILTQNFELLNFQPAANSTPAKFLFNKTTRNIMKQYAEQQHYWKKPIVLDPRLSARYDAVFPSLEVSSNIQPPSTIQNSFFCAFCKNNKSSAKIYTSHILRDLTGRLCCPILRKHKCPRCGANGDFAHTNKYCPKNPNVKVLSIKNNQSFHYKF